MLTKEQAVPGTIFYVKTSSGPVGLYLITKIDLDKNRMTCISIYENHLEELPINREIGIFTENWEYCCSLIEISQILIKRLGGVDESD